MRIFVINLEKDYQRRDSMSSQLSSSNLEFEFVDGVFGKLLSDYERTIHYDEKKAFRNQCRSLVDSEIGIALSHINVYKKIIFENIEFACVFEDDVIIPTDLESVIKEIESVISNNVPQIILMSPALSKGHSVKLGNKYELRPFLSGSYASSYVINQLAAKVLVKVLYPVNDVADNWNRISKHKFVDIMVVSPNLIFQDQNKFGSSTTDDLRENVQFTLVKYIKFKLCRLFWISIDSLVAFYHRHFKLYARILK